VRLLARTAIARAFAEPGGVGLELADGARLTGSHLLVAAGRKPNVEGLGLEAAGIDHTPRGITVGRNLRTSNRRVHAVGDVAGGAFTHEAGHQAGLVIRNALFGLPVRAERHVPRVIYGDPELAQAGLTEAEARAAHGGAVKVLRWPFSGNDRAQAEGRTDGLVKVITGRRGLILGCGIVGPEAGELIQPWVLALQQRLRISQMIAPVLPYPTRGEASRRAALEYFADFASNSLVRRVIRLIGALNP
jgi:pyruvate/2-oxoglutarate dehydrogenase complex dihydrolipoamide dehydrogenase (E3) component